LKGHAQHVLAGASPSDQEIFDLKFADFGDSTALELKVKYTDGDNKMLLGDEFSEWLRKNRDQADGVLEQFKLTLCPQYRDSTVVRRAFKALGIARNDLPEMQVVYTDLLTRCHKWIRDRMQTHYGEEAYRPGYWDEIPIELQLTMPVMWEGIGRGIMRNAAKDAGFDKTVLRSEPLCAAASYIYEGWKAGRVKV
jgi:hypothetical protein